MDIIDLILGDKLKGVPRKIAYVLVWLAMMAALVIAVLTTILFVAGLGL